MKADADPTYAPAAAVDGRKRELLDRYIAALLRRNAVVNLTAARTPEAVAAHVADSLAVAAFVREPFVDIGSGGGFPAIPLAIVTGFRGTLVEAVQKKARFLAEIVEELELPLAVRAIRAEDAGRDAELRGQFASATARAVASLPAVLELTIPLLAVGGVAVLQRGRLEARERTAAVDASLVLGATLEDERRLSGDADADERRVVLVRKIAPTSGRFPRRAGIPAKRPLCYDAEDSA